VTIAGLMVIDVRAGEIGHFNGGHSEHSGLRHARGRPLWGGL
jgi:hypothetical protein